MNIEYYILNPTGNITALVIDKGIDEKNYNSICNEIMSRHSEVEQVGFVNFEHSIPYLRMTGGEFCGNATMSAAVLFHYLINSGFTHINVSVFGSKEAFRVDIIKKKKCYLSAVCIDRPTEINDYLFEINGKSFCFPIVNMEGISHIIADSSIVKSDAELLVKKYCTVLNVPAIGIMLFDKATAELEPLVYVKACDTIFFENSCISGSCALSAYLTEHSTGKTEISLIQPGGIIKTISGGKYDKIKLFGTVIIENHLIEEICL